MKIGVVIVVMTAASTASANPYESRVLSNAEVVAVQQHIEEGVTAWQDARFEDAIKAFRPQIGLLRESQTMMIVRPALYNLLRDALVYTALAYHRLAQGEQPAYGNRAWVARYAMAEVIRNYPERFDRKRYGPEAFALYRRTLKWLDSGGQGRLIVLASKPDAWIFINGRFVGMTRHSETVYPGRYWVCERGTVRQYVADVAEGQKVVLRIE